MGLQFNIHLIISNNNNFKGPEGSDWELYKLTGRKIASHWFVQFRQVNYLLIYFLNFTWRQDAPPSPLPPPPTTAVWLMTWVEWIDYSNCGWWCFLLVESRNRWADSLFQLSPCMQSEKGPFTFKHFPFIPFSLFSLFFWPSASKSLGTFLG